MNLDQADRIAYSAVAAALVCVGLLYWGPPVPSHISPSAAYTAMFIFVFAFAMIFMLDYTSVDSAREYEGLDPYWPSWWQRMYYTKWLPWWDPAHGQYFREPGTGAVMNLGYWYVMSDSGSMVLPSGYATAEAACAAYDLWNMEASFGMELVVPHYGGCRVGWADMDGINVVYANHLLDWWRYTDYAMLLECNSGHPLPKGGYYV